MKDIFDVIIMGGGGSGLAAAVSAAENGGEVAVFEKYAELGGTTGIAVGSITANRTKIQARAGVLDTLEAHAEDAGLFAPPQIEARNNDALRKWFLDQSAETIDWLTSMGLNFLGPNPEPPNRVPRMHNVIPGAKAYISVLHARLIHLGGLVFTKSPIIDLIREGERVAGVIAEIEGVPTRFYARNGVVLAAGDYTNSEALIARFKGSRYANIEGINERSLGDGHILAEKSGAKLVNMDVTYGPELRFIAPRKKTFQQLLPTRGPLSKLMGLIVPYMPQAIMNIMIRRLLVTWQHPENSLFDHGAILVNANGERFCDETTWPEREIAIAKQPGKICYILLDGRLIKQYSAWPNFISTAPKIGYAYTQDYLRLRPDVCVQTNKLDDLAAARQLPLSALKASIATANQKRMESDRLPKLETGPWMLLGPAKAYFTTTEGGVLINKQLQALDESLNPIPGLYAVGQNGLGGQILWGHGLHICWAITSGRLAGKLLTSAESNR